MIYLSSPYSHPFQSKREERFDLVCRHAGFLMAKGIQVYSPIAHCHPIAVRMNLDPGWEYWAEHNTFMLKACMEMLILKIDGYQTSNGIFEEVKIMRTLRGRIYSCNMYADRQQWVLLHE